MEFIFHNGQKVILTPEEFEGVLYSVAKKTIEMVRRETMSRAEAIRILGSRSALDKYVERGMIHPITAGGNSKWKVLSSEVLEASRIHERTIKLSQKRADRDNSKNQ